jgi:acyl-CoA synthetase (AMP-forming)/AMP-acid ligase II
MRSVLFETAKAGAIHGSLCSGQLASGVLSRFCSPETTTAVPINKPGELHMSGPSVITGYLVGCNKEDFCVEDENQRFKSGDQAFMDKQNHTAITGRSKQRHEHPSWRTLHLRDGTGSEHDRWNGGTQTRHWHGQYLNTY